MASRDRVIKKNSYKTRTPPKLANRLKVLMTEREMTLEDLERKSKISAGTLWKISNGGNCTVRTVMRIMQALKCEAVDIWPELGKGAKG